MPLRLWDSGYWTHPDIQPLSKDGKYFYFYLGNNEHCNQAGLYEITPRTICFETGLLEADLPSLFTELQQKVIWYPELNLIWVKNFLKRQSKSPKFLQAAAKCLTQIHANGPVQALLDYNETKYNLSIPYQYYIDTLSITLLSCTSTVNNKGEGRGKKPGKGAKGVDIIK